MKEKQEGGLSRPGPASEQPDHGVGKLQDLVIRLRSPEGCPWDREQTLVDLRAYLIEEAHEVAAAIDTGDLGEVAGELGDLLFQVVFIARLGEEAGAFDLGDVAAGVHAKMVARHPHVFGDGHRLADAKAVRQSWERQKLTAAGGRRSLLDGVPASLPALTAAYRITQKAAGVGFDWPHAEAVLDKVREELGELEEALADASGSDSPVAPESGPVAPAVREELGDLLFAVANLARHLGMDPEATLAQGNRKFRRRFEALERSFARRGRSIGDATLEEMDREWEAVKRQERATSDQ